MCFFRGEITCDGLVELIDHLPSHSRLNAMISQDPEAADAIAEQQDLKPGPPPLSEWTAEMAALATIADRLAAVQQTIVATAGKRPKPVDPYPRPVTEFDRAKERAKEKRHEQMKQMVQDRRRYLAEIRGS